MKRLTILALAAVCLLVSGSCAPIEALLGNEPLPVYDQMLQALEAGEQQLVLKGEFTEDTLKKTYRQIRGERPDLFWLGSSWAGVIETSPVFGKTATLTVS